jgi:GT2 family glycosyltransferase
MLVVDNASTDDTVHRARLVGFDVYEAGVNNGFAAGCNAGLRLASTEFVLFCNPDVVPSTTVLERLLAALTSDPTAALAGTQARAFARISVDITSFLPSWLQRRAPGFKRQEAIANSRDNTPADYVVGAFMVGRTAVLRSLDGFDERFFLYCEEEDLSRRLGERGWRTLLVPSAKVSHEAGTSSAGVDEATMAPFLFHSRYWYYRKHHPRAYAEVGRLVNSAFVSIDRGYRALTRQKQVYGPRTAVAPFRSIDWIRNRHEGRRDGREA